MSLDFKVLNNVMLFYLLRNNLMSWLSDTEQQLDQLNSEANVNDPDKIKQRYF